MIVYTDGSRIPGQDNCGYAGVGIWFGDDDPRNSSIQVISDTPTNQLAELLAIEHTLDFCQHNRDITIKTDSKYSIDCITTWSRGWMKNGWKTSNGKPVNHQELIKSILDHVSIRESKSFATSFEHVYGHSKIHGNECADKLAVAASQRAERYAMDNTIYFHSHTHGEYKCFSQFYPCNIVVSFEGEDTLYNCAEQHHHHRKALLFNDMCMADKIMLASNPGSHRKLGRKVSNFNQEIWVANRYDICKRCTIAKFTQHPELRTILMSTKGKRIAESSPDDCVWGIGLSASNSIAKRRWMGINLLGQVLDDVRDNEL